jgi:Interferon-induced transmembrane protein
MTDSLPDAPPGPAASAPPGWYQASDGQWYPTQQLPQPPPQFQQHAAHYGQPMQPNGVTLAKPSSNMVGAVLATLLCFFPLGIVACIYASQVDSKWNAGDRAGAIAASKSARLFSNLALGAAALIFASVVAFSVLISTTSHPSSAYTRCIADPATTIEQCQRLR